MYCAALHCALAHTHTQAINMDPGCAGVWAAAVNCATRLEADAAVFNAANRWRKRGTHCMPVKYNMSTKGYEQGIIVRLCKIHI